MPKLTANFVALVQLCQFECYSAHSKDSPLRTENLRLTDKNAEISDILAEFTWDSSPSPLHWHAHKHFGIRFV